MGSAKNITPPKKVFVSETNKSLCLATKTHTLLTYTGTFNYKDYID